MKASLAECRFYDDNELKMQLEQMTQIKYLFNKAGGLSYHWLARRYRHSTWQPFRAELEKNLNLWQPPTSHLVLVGPSGGYNLPSTFLARFQKVSALDPDPLAPYFFRQTHPSVPVEWNHQDYFHLPHFDVAAFAKIGALNPQAAFLFCNFLGQLPLLATDFFRDPRREESYHIALTEFLSRRTWASFHDLYSSRRSPENSLTAAAEHFQNWALAPLKQNPLFLSQLYSKNYISEIEVTDHLTSHLWPEGSHRCIIPWQLSPKSFHIVEYRHQNGLSIDTK